MRKNYLWLYFCFVLLIFTSSNPIKSSSFELRISKAPVLNVYASPNESLELVTQALYNETLHVFEQRGDWIRVLVPHQYRESGGYPGWVLLRDTLPAQGQIIYGKTWTVVSRPKVNYYAAPSLSSKHKVIYFGTTLEYHGYKEELQNNGASIYWLKCSSLDGETGWLIHDGGVSIRRGSPFIENEDGRTLVSKASAFTGAPYLWGGMTVKGMDCSGLTYTLYRYFGYLIPRDADQQFLAGDYIGIYQLIPGDLLFYGIGQEADHVAIYAGNNKMIDANRSRGVTLRNADFQGKFIGARRMFKNPVYGQRGTFIWSGQINPFTSLNVSF